MLEIKNLDSFIAPLLLGIVDFLDLAKFLLFDLANFLFQNSDNFSIDPDLKPSTSISLAVLLSSSSAIVSDRLVEIFNIKVSVAAILLKS